jgi:hypothetical protein
MESIDDLLAQVKAEYQEKQVQEPKKLPLFEEEFNSPEPLPYQSKPSSQKWNSPAEDSLLAQMKAEFEEQQRTEELKKQQKLREEETKKEQQLQEEKIRVQQREQRRREALTKEATEWLKTLNPRSDEGRWFEEFSYSYSSKLEAAIEYLQALRETYR